VRADQIGSEVVRLLSGIFNGTITEPVRRDVGSALAVGETS